MTSVLVHTEETPINGHKLIDDASARSWLSGLRATAPTIQLVKYLLSQSADATHTRNTLCEATGLKSETVVSILRNLTKQGLLNRIVFGYNLHGYQLAKPAVVPEQRQPERSQTFTGVSDGVLEALQAQRGEWLCVLTTYEHIELKQYDLPDGEFKLFARIKPGD